MHRARRGLTRRRLLQGAGVVSAALLTGCGRLPGQVQPAKLPHIGILLLASGPTSVVVMALQEGLQEYGYVEGQNITIERRTSADPDFADLDALAAELVGLPVDLLLALNTPSAQAARRVTSSVPIVFTAVSDPIGAGLATSLGRPGGNATGLSDFGSALSGKRLELIRDAVPGTTRVGVVWGARNPANELQWQELQAVAPALGVALIALKWHDYEAVPDLFETAVAERAQALLVLGSPDVSQRVAALAAAFRLPTLLEQPTAARTDGLLAYGPNRPELHRRAAYYVDRILKGAKPAELPIEQPTRFDFIVNLKTAQALGLTIPQHVLLQATEVIQ
jgi:putative ABC transport system substrate-binding protein